jgi:large subunit ribosomal protein L1
MARHGKKYLEAAKLVDRERLYLPLEAAELVKETTVVGFDASVEVHMRLGVDPRHADQMVRGTVVSARTGKVVRVAVFAQGEGPGSAQGGADGPAATTGRIEAGLEFDVALATPDAMGLVGKLGKILGRRGLMPNPKAGTITFDLERAISEVKGGRVEYKVDKAGIVHVAVGKSSFEADAIVENLAALIDAISRAKPAGVRASTSRPHDREHHGPGASGRRAGDPRRGRRGLTSPAGAGHPDDGREASPDTRPASRRTARSTDNGRSSLRPSRAAHMGRRAGLDPSHRTGRHPRGS